MIKRQNNEQWEQWEQRGQLGAGMLLPISSHLIHNHLTYPADQDVQEVGHLTPCHETCMYHFLLSKE